MTVKSPVPLARSLVAVIVTVPGETGRHQPLRRHARYRRLATGPRYGPAGQTASAGILGYRPELFRPADRHARNRDLQDQVRWRD
jgi:hypothetical protein